MSKIDIVPKVSDKGTATITISFNRKTDRTSFTKLNFLDIELMVKLE